VRKEIYMLSKILTVANQEFGITLPMGNPVKNIRKPKENNSRNRRLSESELNKLIEQCKASRNRWLLPALVISVETAMRQGELLQLTWSMIDKKRHLALLLDPDKIKTEEPRAVPLSSTALAVIESLPHSLDGLLIPVERMTLYHAFHAACERAGIEDYTWHDLRHEAMSRLGERGDMSIIELASISGHKTLQMVKKYTHLDAEKLAKKLGNSRISELNYALYALKSSDIAAFEFVE
jgi:integrase